jgi:general secretion pathway protein H
MRSPQRQAGFTLVEILVVIFIVATVASIALLSVGVASEDEELETEHRRLASLIETVQDEGVLQGREFGIEFMTSAYRFVEFDPLTRQWTEIPFDELYRLRTLPEGLEFVLYIDDKLIELESNPRQLDDPDKDMARSSARPYVPHLFIFASGESTVFEIHVWRPATDGRLVMRGDVLGQIEFGEEDDS